MYDDDLDLHAPVRPDAPCPVYGVINVLMLIGREASLAGWALESVCEWFDKPVLSALARMAP